MPQMNKGGKFIFGKSLIREDGTIRFPDLAIREYDITAEGRIYLFTGSKSTGGFCVTRKGLLAPSKLGHILEALPELRDYTEDAGRFRTYKGRAYAWSEIAADGTIILSGSMLAYLRLRENMKLLSIRSSDIAFTMGAFGLLYEESLKHDDAIPVY